MSATLKPHTRNVTKLFRQASPEDLAAGRDWYEQAHQLAVELAAEFDGFAEEWTVERAAAVIAVLSPRLSWPKNVEVARTAYAMYHNGWLTRDGFVKRVPVLNANADKAWRLLNGEPPDSVVSGPKVRAFWHTIAHPHDPRAVVVDRHAIDVALGRVTDDRTRGLVLGKKGAYDAVAACYANAARILSLELRETWTPAAVQAVTWTTWRRTRAAAYHKGA